MEPLTTIAIQVDVDGITVRGVIVRLLPNDMTVAITSPVSGFTKGLHVPHFAMYPQNWLATWQSGATAAITSRGQRKAVQLVEELYRETRGS